MCYIHWLQCSTPTCPRWIPSNESDENSLPLYMKVPCKRVNEKKSCKGIELSPVHFKASTDRHNGQPGPTYHDQYCQMYNEGQVAACKERYNQWMYRWVWENNDRYWANYRRAATYEDAGNEAKKSRDGNLWHCDCGYWRELNHPGYHPPANLPLAIKDHYDDHPPPRPAQSLINVL